MPSGDAGENCGYAAKRKNPDCGDHTTPEPSPALPVVPVRDRFKGSTGIDPAPNYPVNVALNGHTPDLR